MARSMMVVLAASLTLLLAPYDTLNVVYGQAPCAPVPYPALGFDLETCDLGAPGEDGVTITSGLATSDQIRAFRFSVGPQPRAAYVYVGDQWYNLAMGIYERLPGPQLIDQKIAEWLQVVKKDDTGSRVLQFVRPEKVVKDLKANTTYTLLVNAPTDEGFDPRRGFTVRVALGPPPCSDPQRDPDDRYQLTVSTQPPLPGPFDLISFNAVVSPPYSDLFDFEWQVNGQRFPGDWRETIQIPAPELLKSGSIHDVGVTARGARVYPDPDQPHIPPTLSANCILVLRPR